MTTLVALAPSPPLPLPPDSYSSRPSSPCSTSSGRQPPPPLPTYTSFDITKFTQARPVTYSQPSQPPPVSASRRSARPGHRSSQSMSRINYPPAIKVVDFATRSTSPTPSPPASKRAHRPTRSVDPGRTFEPADGVAPSVQATAPPSSPRPVPLRFRTLSFSTAQQAFLPSRARAPASLTSSSSAVLPFPTVEAGKAASSVQLDRSSSTGSSASFPSRRPRPSRLSMSTRSGSSLRVPGSVDERDPGGTTDYLEAKVVILGSQGVGKTSLITRSTTGRFKAARTSTIGASLLAKKLVIDNTKVHLQLWDAAGQERFRTLAPLFYRGALAAVLVYDVTSEASLQDVKFWMAELRKNMPDELIIVVVGAKADLADSCPTIPLAEAQRKIAVWRDELERNERGESPSAPASTLLSRSRSPGDPVSEVLWNEGPPIRPRTYSSPSAATIPTITTTGPPPTPPHVANPLRSSTRSTRSGQSTSPPSPRLAATLTRPIHTLTTSATMPDLTGYALGGLPSRGQHAMTRTASSDSSQSQTSSATSATTTSSQPPASPPQAPPRSLSSFGLMNLLPGGGGNGSSASSSTATLPGAASAASTIASAFSPTRRRSLEDRAGVGALLRENLSSHTAARRAAAAAEEARLDALVDQCPIEVIEVSAKDGFGVEDVFRSIAEQLIEHRAEIERRQQKLRHKDSIILREDDPAAEQTRAAGCAC